MLRKYTDIDLATLENRSLLVIDDNLSLHRDYKAVLRPDQSNEGDSKLDELEDLLLAAPGYKRPPKRQRNFEIQSAYQGEEACELVRRHLAKGIRYPLAFVDMRMPPGWDGLETIHQIREIDPAMRFVIVTAYSDYSDAEIQSSLGPQTPVSIVHKPFEPTKLYELTYELVADWNQRQTDGA
ncbi:response regulator [Pelagicoccus sp. SDUM812005]|uniref:response regulator n=1 Tax=Pelagicoccus sp. SDUM812005 TaxID=3041257 RepID=UPI00280E8B15|nr:response regulator [Pelagicoccus sp. SDUM812005]MDQ8180478.1 response regulator [Pelagicoccus sp. SDUM812005]